VIVVQPKSKLVNPGVSNVALGGVSMKASRTSTPVALGLIRYVGASGGITHIVAASAGVTLIRRNTKTQAKVKNFDFMLSILDPCRLGGSRVLPRWYKPEQHEQGTKYSGP
jgi:hypothetical protein